jgi:hypothetical protein
MTQTTDIKITPANTQTRTLNPVSRPMPDTGDGIGRIELGIGDSVVCSDENGSDIDQFYMDVFVLIPMFDCKQLVWENMPLNMLQQAQQSLSSMILSRGSFKPIDVNVTVRSDIEIEKKDDHYILKVPADNNPYKLEITFDKKEIKEELAFVRISTYFMQDDKVVSGSGMEQWHPVFTKFAMNRSLNMLENVNVEIRKDGNQIMIEIKIFDELVKKFEGIKKVIEGIKKDEKFDQKKAIDEVNKIIKEKKDELISVGKELKKLSTDVHEKLKKAKDSFKFLLHSYPEKNSEVEILYQMLAKFDTSLTSLNHEWGKTILIMTRINKIKDVKYFENFNKLLFGDKDSLLSRINAFDNKLKEFIAYMNEMLRLNSNIENYITQKNINN